MMNEQITIDAEKQKQARQYARIRRRLWLVGTAVSVLYALAWLVFGWSAALYAWLARFSTNAWFLVAAFALVFGGIYSLLNLPLAFHRQYTLPHRFDLSNQTFKGWLLDQLKSMLVSVPLGLLLLEGLYAFLRAFPATWWIWAAVAMFIFSVLMANLSPVLIMPLFNKFVPLGEEHADLEKRLLDLARRANTKVRGVFKFDMSKRSKAANAALTGIGSTRRIVLGDTLINEFTTDEIETVLAHELGHHVHKDIPLYIFMDGLLTLVGFFLASRVMDLGQGWLDIPVASIASLPLFMLVMDAYNLVLMPLANAFSRWRERMADAYSLQVTGKQAAFASAFVRLANQNLGEVEPERWVVWMFYDHPPLAERIAMANDWKSPVT